MSWSAILSKRSQRACRKTLNRPTRRTKHGMTHIVPPVVVLPWATLIMSSHRMERVSELVKREVSEVVQELNLAYCGFITITAAEISPDLKEGRIFMSVIGSVEQKQRAIETLERQHAHIQHELARRIVLKYTPRLRFVLDETEARASHIEHLLDELGDTPGPEHRLPGTDGQPDE